MSTRGIHMYYMYAYYMAAQVSRWRVLGVRALGYSMYVLNTYTYDM